MADAPLEVSVQEAQRLIAQRGADLRIIDVREPDEFEICRLPAAELIPLATIATAAPEKLPDKETPMLVYCHHGMRSLQATRKLRDLGYSQVSSVAGGIDQWATLIDPATPRY